MTRRPPRDVRPGRPVVFSDAPIDFGLSIKVLFKLPLRQTAGMVASLLRLAGLDWLLPYFFSLCRRQKTLSVQVLYGRADGPLNLLVDNNGSFVILFQHQCTDEPDHGLTVREDPDDIGALLDRLVNALQRVVAVKL